MRSQPEYETSFEGNKERLKQTNKNNNNRKTTPKLQEFQRRTSGLIRGLQNRAFVEIRRVYLDYKRKRKGEHTYPYFLVEIFVSYGRMWTSACFNFLVYI